MSTSTSYCCASNRCLLVSSAFASFASSAATATAVCYCYCCVLLLLLCATATAVPACCLLLASSLMLAAAGSRTAGASYCRSIILQEQHTTVVKQYTIGASYYCSEAIHY